MATKKKHTAKRRRRHLPMAAKSHTRRRRRKSGGLSDMFNPTTAMHSAKATLAAGGGGMGAVFVNKMLPSTMGKFPKILIAFAGGFLASNFNMPSAGAGFTGGMIATTFANGFMGDDMEENEFADENSLSDMPVYLEADGTPYVIEEGNDGNSYTRYLSEEEIKVLNDEA